MTYQKIKNVDFGKYNLKSFETEIRSEIGAILNPKEVSKIKNVIDNLINNSDKICKKLFSLRKKKIFNLCKSAGIGAQYLTELVNK